MYLYASETIENWFWKYDQAQQQLFLDDKTNREQVKKTHAGNNSKM